MNEINNFFRLLTAEESCIISGGNMDGMGSMPYFAITPTQESKEGRIINADGHGRNLNIYGSQSSDKKTQTTQPPYQDLGLPSVVNANSKMM